MRDEILKLLNGEKVSSKPAFSGLIHITEEGLASEGFSFNEIHMDAQKMARAAASTFKLTGMPSAALPLDLCAPAEMLGAELRYYADEGMRFPQVGKVKFESTRELTTESTEFTELLERGRMKLICEAIELVKQDVGKEIVISGMIPGPFTLLLYVCRPKNVFIEIKKDPESVRNALFHLSSFLAKVGQAYFNSGADFITIQKLTGELPKPRVLSVCGKTELAMNLLATTGADAISVDQMTDLVKSRAALKDVMLFGNLDPVATLYQGDKAQILEAVQRSNDAGVDAVWPGCDLVVQTPIEHIKLITDRR